MSKFAWVTLVTNDRYALGALVLGNSLRRSNTKFALHILYTDGISSSMKLQLISTFNNSTKVDILDSNDSMNLSLIGRPDLGVTFTKLHCWRLTEYEKCVFLDADTLIIQNCDELFEHPEFAAAPDIGWPDLFNSGVFVFVPSNDTYQKLVEFGTQHGTFDGGDQGLLNQYFSNWRKMDESHRLPFIYNVTPGSIYSYKAAWQLFGSQVKIIHFLGTMKPWHFHEQHHGQHWDYWRKIFDEDIASNLSKDLENLIISTPKSPDIPALLHKNNIINPSLYEIMADATYGDVIIFSSSGKEIISHRCILGKCSKKFASAFTEAKEIPFQIEIKEFDTQIIKAALEFCYGKYDNFIGNETKLFEFAVNFEMENLKKACLAYFGENITSENVCEIIQIAYSHNFQSLKKKCHRVFAENKSKIAPEQLLKLPKEILVDVFYA